MGESLGVHEVCSIHDALTLILAESRTAKVNVGRSHHGEGGMMMVVVPVDECLHPGTGMLNIVKVFRVGEMMFCGFEYALGERVVI